MRYAVVIAEGTKKLVEEVTRMIGEGWEPIGGINSVTYHDSCYDQQAMIHREPMPAPSGGEGQ